MFNCTEAFLIRHVRNLATIDGGDSRDNVINRAGIILVARQEEFGHEHPNTVLFLYPTDMAAIGDFLQNVGPNQQFHYQGRIPYVVTWLGHTRYTVVENAAGFVGNTNSAGECNHYADVLTDQNSHTTLWNAPGL